MRSFVLPPSCWQGWAGPFWELWPAKGHASRTLAAQAAQAGGAGARRPSCTTWAESKGGSKSAFNGAPFEAKEYNLVHNANHY